MPTSFKWSNEISNLYDMIFSFDDQNKSWTHDDFIAHVDGQLFTKISDIGAPLPLSEFVAFCELVKQHNGRHLLCDKDYGHMGLGILGLRAVFDPLVKQMTHDEEAEAKRQVIHCLMSGRRMSVATVSNKP